MTDEQFAELLKAVKPEPPSLLQRLEPYITVLGLAGTLFMYLNFGEVKEKLEMIEVYQSARQSKTAELIGTLRGQGDKRTADILEILLEQEKRESEKMKTVQTKGF